MQIISAYPVFWLLAFFTCYRWMVPVLLLLQLIQKQKPVVEIARNWLFVIHTLLPWVAILSGLLYSYLLLTVADTLNINIIELLQQPVWLKQFIWTIAPNVFGVAFLFKKHRLRYWLIGFYWLLLVVANTVMLRMNQSGTGWLANLLEQALYIFAVLLCWGITYLIQNKKRQLPYPSLFLK